MNIILKSVLFMLCCMFVLSCSDKQKKVLIFTKTAEFRHSSIEKGSQAIMALLESKNILVDTTENAAYFTEDSLKRYDAVLFLNTTGDVLSNRLQADFERYIQAGGGFVGVHAATDTEYNWPWYNKLVGAYFDGHPAIQDANLTCSNSEEPCCKHLPEVWRISEEWYNFKSIHSGIEVIMEVDESSYDGGTLGASHPAVWKHQYDGGRSFYTALGHKDETYEDSLYMQQVYAGIEFAMGEGSLDYSKATTMRMPEENRFNKSVLDFNLDEPMELDQLGNRGIIYIERRGAVKLFDFETNQIKLLDSIDVHYKDEDGLLGIAVDPNYEKNNWIYLFYSPNKEEELQQVSRFTLVEDKLEDERIVIQIPLIRECCHSGGSLEFGPDGLLYIGVGDNTNPFESLGYAPIDERKDRQLFDAQKSAANTNDLRGKILRIKPEADGSYSIPEGNLFPKGTDNCRPEIYVMGVRNPFRFSIDTKTNLLYWGDVGPDAGSEDSLRGPEGMGEFNQAREAGFYGWPYSRGNNQMYRDFDFGREASGKVFNPNKIVNNSPNNTGLEELPPIKESMIWYGYKSSKEFPWLGDGGVNPMSGPIYHAEDYTQSDHSFPRYFEGKWFVYEWMRDWIYVVELDKDNQLVQADPFMSTTEFSHPMDMTFGKDGRLYMLEYGQKWNSRNLDARLSVIEYNKGNRPPVATFEVDKEVGAAPLTVQLSAGGSHDFDNDDLLYNWTIEGEETKSTSPDLAYVFEKPGTYNVMLTVIDTKGEKASVSQKIMAGNEPPELSLNLSDTNSIYWKSKAVSYAINVSDLEDGSMSNGQLDTSRIKVTFSYIPEGEDLILASIGHQQNKEPRGLQLINESGCKACHAIDKKVAGPSYEEVAKRYDQTDKQTIIRRIIKGSQGVWGETMMAPHPQLKIEEVEEIVNYVLSLDPEKHRNEDLVPLKGRLIFDKHMEDEVAGKYVLMASYLDQGNPNVDGSALSAMEEFIFLAPRIEIEDTPDLSKTLGVWESDGRTLVGSIQDGRFIKLNIVTFDGLNSISIGAAFSKNYHYYGEVEVRRGGLDGTVLGTGEIENFNESKDVFNIFKIDIRLATGTDDLYLVFKNQKEKDQYIMNGDWLQLNYK